MIVNILAWTTIAVMSLLTAIWAIWASHQG